MARKRNLLRFSSLPLIYTSTYITILLQNRPWTLDVYSKKRKEKKKEDILLMKEVDYLKMPPNRPAKKVKLSTIFLSQENNKLFRPGIVMHKHRNLTHHVKFKKLRAPPYCTKPIPMDRLHCTPKDYISGNPTFTDWYN